MNANGLLTDMISFISLGRFGALMAVDGYDLGDRPMQAWALNDLGVVHQLTGDYPAAAASHQQALKLFCDLGARLGQAETLNNLGQLATRTSATPQARDRHTHALAIARDLGVPLEQARALEGIADSHLHDGNPAQDSKRRARRRWRLRWRG